MADCALCSFSGQKIIETQKIIAGLPSNPSVPGHVIVFPKQHVSILEQAPLDVIEEVFKAANMISIAQFEGLRAQGTNILMMNGLAAGQKVPHISVEVIPRVKDDGINFAWPSRKLSDEHMSMVSEQIKQAAFMIPSEKVESHLEPEEKPESEEKLGQAHEPSPRTKEKKKEDYFIRQLRRIP